MNCATSSRIEHVPHDVKDDGTHRTWIFIFLLMFFHSRDRLGTWLLKMVLKLQWITKSLGERISRILQVKYGRMTYMFQFPKWTQIRQNRQQRGSRQPGATWSSRQGTGVARRAWRSAVPWGWAEPRCGRWPRCTRIAVSSAVTHRNKSRESVNTHRSVKQIKFIGIQVIQQFLWFILKWSERWKILQWYVKLGDFWGCSLKSCFENVNTEEVISLPIL
jgi:hypothetical protein